MALGLETLVALVPLVAPASAPLSSRHHLQHNYDKDAVAEATAAASLHSMSPGRCSRPFLSHVAVTPTVTRPLLRIVRPREAARARHRQCRNRAVSHLQNEEEEDLQLSKETQNVKTNSHAMN